MGGGYQAKEQREYGSCLLTVNRRLRCSLVVGKSPNPLKSLSNQLNIIPFSTLVPKATNLNPWFITGLIDGEGCFCTTIYKNSAYKTGWVVRSFFEII